MPYLNEEQAKAFQKIGILSSEIIQISDFGETFNRTLTLGSNADRTAFLHVYLKNEKICLHLYANSEDDVLQTIETRCDVNMYADTLRPKRRVNPKTTDFEFASLMIFARSPLRFEKYSKSEEPEMIDGVYFGKLPSMGL